MIGPASITPASAFAGAMLTAAGRAAVAAEVEREEAWAVLIAVTGCVSDDMRVEVARRSHRIADRLRTSPAPWVDPEVAAVRSVIDQVVCGEHVATVVHELDPVGVQARCVSPGCGWFGWRRMTEAIAEVDAGGHERCPSWPTPHIRLSLGGER